MRQPAPQSPEDRIYLQEWLDLGVLWAYNEIVV